MKKKVNYINNKTLYGAMIQHKNEVQQALLDNKSKPQVPRYIGESIILICNNLAKKPNFSGYTYKDDMIGDAMIDCIAAVKNFNPDKTSNPFAYFTQIAWNAFIRRIYKEKKQTYIKHKNFENLYLMDELFSGESNIQLGTNEYSNDVVKSYEIKLTKPKKTSKLSGIVKFSENEDEK